MILEDMIHEICILQNTIQENDEAGDKAVSFFKNLPEEYLELMKSR